MNTKNYNLIVVAHPDDETIYFSGLIQTLNDLPWKIICVTDGDADEQGELRTRDFHNACRLQKVDEYDQWNYQDIYEKRIDVHKLSQQLVELPLPQKVFTHGIIGEYGHPHHQDVSFAVHDAFSGKTKVMSVAYNNYPEMIVNLSKKEFQLKTEILLRNYASELVRFAHLVPSTFCEGYSEISLAEVSAIYHALSNRVPVDIKDLDKYSLLIDHINETLITDRARLF